MWSSLTTMRSKGNLVSVNKKLTNLPLNALLQIARLAGQRAAANATAAGREVAGWKDGRLVEYGHDVLSFLGSATAGHCDKPV